MEEYLIHKGYFVQHNIKFRPDENHDKYDKKLDSTHSDIDVIGYHPNIEGEEKVKVVSCKSWQKGFSPASYIGAISKEKKVNGRPAWKAFRELTVPKWSEAFLRAVKDATGEDQFTYVTAVTCLTRNSNKGVWENHTCFRDALNGNPIKVLTLPEMVTDIRAELTETLARTEVGRMIQLFSAADILPTEA